MMQEKKHISATRIKKKLLYPFKSRGVFCCFTFNYSNIFLKREKKSRDALALGFTFEEFASFSISAFSSLLRFSGI